MKLSFFGAALATTLALASAAQANGRFPASNAIQFSETDPDLVLLRVTFGLLVSHDRGKTFAWTCEQNVGFSGNEDPMYAVTPTGAIFSSTYQGISISRNAGCDWKTVVDPTSGLARQVFIDLASNPNDGKHLVVFASTYDKQDTEGNLLFGSKLWETRDDGASWTQIVSPFDARMLGYTIDLTKSDPQRIYATMTRSPGTPQSTGILLTSKDHAASWDPLEVPFVNGETGVYIAAVDPVDAERVYLRTSNAAGAPTRLLLREATDGGPATLRTLYTATADLLGFALTPAGDKVYIGGPKDGLLVASTSDFQFQKRSSIEVQCLALAADGVWACSSESSGFIAGLSKDDGATFASVARFCDITGPLSCAAEDAGSTKTCNALWPSQSASLGCVPDAGSPAVTPDAGTAVPESSDSGCGSRNSSATPWGALVALAAAAFAVTRRRRG